MGISKTLPYALLAILAALAYGIRVGPYWVTNADLLAVIAGVVAWFSFRRGHRAGLSEAEASVQVPRSRITHYVNVSRIKSPAYTAKESNSPFERALLSEPGWRKFPAEKLAEITQKTPITPDNVTP